MSKLDYSQTRISASAANLFLIFIFATACGSGTGNNHDLDGGRGDAGNHDAAMNNPMNPVGLGPAAVDLGAPTDLSASGSYVLLAKTGITNVTGSVITGGHLGVSPTSATAITGFSQMLDASGEFSTSPSVVPPARIYASTYASPTPTLLTSAVLDMQSAYTDAASRTNPTVLNLGSGEIGGETLAPGLYTWGSSVTIPDDVTFAGGADDVWILQISGDLDLSSAQHVVLSGGARAKNIFWQISGHVTLHANTHFEGVILCQTGITLQTGATMTGRALSQSLIALDDNAVTAP